MSVRGGSFAEPQLRALATLVVRPDSPLVSLIRGRSMWPTLPPGVEVRIEAPTAWIVGDVVVFVAGRGLVAHRAVARGRGTRAHAWLITRGDGQVLCDPPGPVSGVVGVVRAWRGVGDATWQPLSTEPARTGWRGLAARAFALAITRALEVHVWAARAVHVACYWLEGGVQPRG